MSAKFITICLGTTLLVTPLVVGAQNIGQEVVFNIDSSYDLQNRQELTAVLAKITDQLYFYADKDWWQKLDWAKKQSLDVAFYNLAIEFERKIYPTLTSTFGSEPRPGIDKDERITLLLHPMISDAGGYFNSGDVYSKLQYPKSNEREMIYLNSQQIDKPEAQSFLAHEFSHLITANQKNLLRKVNEEIWLNEARAEYAITLLGYNDVYKGSNLERRVKDFLSRPSVSLTEWLNEKGDYGVVNLFTQYLLDHYGRKILVDSLQSNKTGIDSLNYALERNGFKEDFSKIFTDWLITLLVNDCQLGSRYCYLDENLKNLKIVPVLYYLPFSSESLLSVLNNSKEWAGNWQKIIGGKGTLTLEFEGQAGVIFRVPYLLCDSRENCQIDFLTLNENQKGKLVVVGFNIRYSFLTIIPSIQNKTSGFDGREPSYSFSWTVTISEKTEEEKEAEKEAKLISQLLARIAELQEQVRQLQAQLTALLSARSQQGATPCRFETDLYFGIRDSVEVRCLQEFLKNQGAEIYPEGLVTGNFLSLTQAAVIRFQEKYSSEILKPLGLTKGTGFFGPMTRAIVNRELAKLK